MLHKVSQATHLNLFPPPPTSYLYIRYSDRIIILYKMEDIIPHKFTYPSYLSPRWNSTISPKDYPILSRLFSTHNRSRIPQIYPLRT